jgi:hypothetical protein
MSRIFVRERTRVGKGDKKPRFVLVAAEGVDLDIFTLHVRKSELDALAAAIGAEVVFLPRGDKTVKAEALPEPVQGESKPKKKKK